MIVLLKDPESLAPRRLSIEKPEIVLGKNADCDVVLASAKVSRRHARIAVHDGGLVIEDLKSTNGTFVNGQALSGASPLGEHDEVRIADFLLQVQRGEVKPAEVKPSDPLTLASGALLLLAVSVRTLKGDLIKLLVKLFCSQVTASGASPRV